MRRRRRTRCYLKHVLYGELHDPGTHVRLNLAESAAIQGRIGRAARETGSARIQEIRTILNVERFSANLRVLMFLYRESTGQRNIDVEVAWAHQVVGAQVTQSTGSRVRKRLGIDITINRPHGAVRVRIYLVWTLAGGVDVVQSAIHSSEDGEVATAVQPHDGCELPVSGNPLQWPGRVVRRLENGREVEVLPNVNRRAVAAIISSIGRVVVRAGELGGLRIADTTSPSVVRQHREVARQPVLRGQKQRVVASRTTVIQEFQGAVIRPLRRIDLSKQAARLLVPESGTGAGLGQAILPRGTGAGGENRRIQLHVRPKMNGIAAQVAGFQQPA